MWWQVLVFSPSMPVGHPVVTLEEFAAFQQLELLSVMLQPARGCESGWRCEFSPALQGQACDPHFCSPSRASSSVVPDLSCVLGSTDLVHIWGVEIIFYLFKFKKLESLQAVLDLNHVVQHQGGAMHRHQQMPVGVEELQKGGQ